MEDKIKIKTKDFETILKILKKVLREEIENINKKNNAITKTK